MRMSGESADERLDWGAFVPLLQWMGFPRYDPRSIIHSQSPNERVILMTQWATGGMSVINVTHVEDYKSDSFNAESGAKRSFRVIKIIKHENLPIPDLIRSSSNLKTSKSPEWSTIVSGVCLWSRSWPIQHFDTGFRSLYHYSVQHRTYLVKTPNSVKLRTSTWLEYSQAHLSITLHFDVQYPLLSFHTTLSEIEKSWFP